MKGGNKMEKSVQITFIIAGAVVLLALIGVYAFFEIIPSNNNVSVVGISKVKVTPDLIGVYFNVEALNKTATQAKDENARIVDDLITALVKKGFERKQIQTLSFSIYEDYSWEDGKRTPKGYRATHVIKVEMSSEQSEKIGEVIDSGVEAGASISYINFELSQEKQNEYKVKALRQATEDARIKAESIAEGLEKKLGRIVSVSNSDFRYYPWLLYDTKSVSSGENVAESAKQATTNIQPGEQDINAQVSVVYKLR